MTPTPNQILQDWEAQARERDWRDPMRAHILMEAAILRRALEERDALAAALTTMGVDPASVIAAMAKP